MLVPLKRLYTFLELIFSCDKVWVPYSMQVKIKPAFKKSLLDHKGPVIKMSLLS